MERVENTIQKPLAGALLLFAASCAVVVGACLVLTLVAQDFRGGPGLSGAARWVLDWCSWICGFALIGSTGALVHVVRRAAARETNVLVALMLASGNLFLVAGMFALLLLGLRTPQPGWQGGAPGLGQVPAGAVRPPPDATRVARQDHAPAPARVPVRGLNR